MKRSCFPSAVNPRRQSECYVRFRESVNLFLKFCFGFELPSAGRGNRSFDRGFETCSLPRSLAGTRRSFTFYLAGPSARFAYDADEVRNQKSEVRISAKRFGVWPLGAAFSASTTVNCANKSRRKPRAISPLARVADGKKSAKNDQAQ